MRPVSRPSVTCLPTSYIQSHKWTVRIPCLCSRIGSKQLLSRSSRELGWGMVRGLAGPLVRFSATAQKLPFETGSNHKLPRKYSS